MVALAPILRELPLDHRGFGWFLCKFDEFSLAPDVQLVASFVDANRVLAEFVFLRDSAWHVYMSWRKPKTDDVEELEEIDDVSPEKPAPKKPKAKT